MAVSAEHDQSKPGSPADRAPSTDLAAVQDALPVQLIATPRCNLQTCRRDEDLAAVVARNKEKFDFFPVTEKSDDGREIITGLVELAPFHHGDTPQGTVSARAQPLSEQNLIGADASILAFVRDADRHPCRLVVSGSEIGGLVSLFDVQKLPVRSALFAMVMHLEMTMSEVIRQAFNGSRGWIDCLSPDRQERLSGEIAKARADDTFVDELLFTQFADKITIIKKRVPLATSKAAFKDAMGKVRDLRDDLAHANEYAGSRKAAEEVCQTVRLMDLWIAELSPRTRARS